MGIKQMNEKVMVTSCPSTVVLKPHESIICTLIATGETQTDYSSDVIWSIKSSNVDARMDGNTCCITSMGYATTIDVYATYLYEGKEKTEATTITVCSSPVVGLSNGKEYNEYRLDTKEYLNTTYKEPILYNSTLYLYEDMNTSILKNHEIDKIIVNGMTVYQDGCPTYDQYYVNFDRVFNNDCFQYRLGTVYSFRKDEIVDISIYIKDYVFTCSTQACYRECSTLQYCVMFDSNGGTTCDEMEVPYHTEIELPQCMSESLFIGWKYGNNVYTSSIVVDEDITLKAVWNACITLTDEDTCLGQYGILDSKLDGYVPYEKEGYELVGWTYNGQVVVDEKGHVTSELSSCTLLALWKPIQYNVTFNACGGVVETASQRVSYQSKIFLPSVERKGYEFLCWKYTQNGKTYDIDDSVVINQSMTLDAIWKKESVSVFFECNGGKCINASVIQHVEYGDSIILPFVQTREDNYIFKGWKYKDSIYDEGASVSVYSDTEFEAIWKEGIQIHLVDLNVTSYDLESIEDGTSVYTEGHKRVGWSLLGWYIGEECIIDAKGNILDGSKLKNGAYLFAQWKRKAYEKASTIEDGRSYVLATSIRDGQAILISRKDDCSVRMDTTLSVDEEENKISTTNEDCIWDAIRVGKNSKLFNLDTDENIKYFLDFNYSYNINVSRDEYTWNIKDSMLCYTRWNDGHTDYYYINYSNDVFALSFNEAKDPIYFYEERPAETAVASTVRPCVFENETIEAAYGSMISVPNIEKEGYELVGWMHKNTLNPAGHFIRVDGHEPFDAIWKEKEYTLTYENNGGFFNPNPSTYLTRKTPIQLEGPKKKGYHFDDWYKDVDFKTKMNTIYKGSSSDYTLYAKWSPVTYKIQYNKGGIHSNPNHYTIEDTPIRLENPSRVGYTFKGWFIDSNRRKQVNQVAAGTYKDFTLYGKWEPNIYTVDFDCLEDRVQVTYDTYYGKLPVPNKKGYTFKYWMMDGEAIQEDTIVSTAKNHTLCAYFEPIQYTIVFKNDQEEISQTFLYDQRQCLQRNEFNKKGYRFVEWNDGKTVYTDGQEILNLVDHKEVIVLNASFIPIQYTVSFDGNSGMGEMESIVCTYDLPCIVESCLFEKTGYSFNGWKEFEGNTILNLTDQEEQVVVSATWLANHYIVSFEGCNETKEVIYDDAYGPLPQAYKTGYAFKGWKHTSYIDENTLVTIADDHSLEPIFEPLIYTIHFDGNGSLDSMEAVSVTYGTSQILPKNTLTKKGYSFVGWEYEGSTYTDEQEIVNVTDHLENITFTAIWQANEYTVVYGNRSKVVTYDSVYGVLEPEQKVGYTFTGWTLNGISIDHESVVSVDEDHTLLATWTANTYIVTFDGKESKEVTFDSVYGTLPEIYKEGYTFTGWVLNDQEIKEDTCMCLAKDHALISSWKANTYSVSFEGCKETKAVVYDSEYGVLPTLEKEGYTFIGWKYNDKTVDEQSVCKIAFDHTLSSEFKANEYIVSFDGKDTKTVTFDSVYGSLPQPEKVGYTFTGWMLENEWIDENRLVQTSKDHLVTSSWKANTYTVSFDGCESVSPIEVTYDQPYQALPVLTKYGYTFTGWYLDGKEMTDTTIVSVGQDHTLKAEFAANTYQYHFDEQIQECVFDSMIESLPIPKKKGYTFDRWVCDDTQISVGDTVKIADNCIFTSSWIANTYKVSFDGQDAKTVKYDSVYGKMPIPKKNGYTFKGWCYQEQPIQEYSIMNTDCDHNLTSSWQANTYRVIFDGDCKEASKVVTYDQEYGQLPVVKKDGYTFKGWTYNKKPVDETTLVQTSSIHTLKASWEANRYTVSFNTNGGQCSIQDKSVVYQSCYETLPECTKVGYTFKGWYVNQQRVDEKSIVNIYEDHRLSARWIANTYKATLDGKSSIALTYNETFKGLPIPVKVGYTFIGWQLDGQKVDETIVFNRAENISLTSSWKANTYTIYFDEDSSKECTFDSCFGTLPTPQKDGYTFVGWMHGNQSVTQDTILTEDKDLHLVSAWSIHTYSIEYVTGFIENNSQNSCEYTIECEDIVLAPLTSSYPDFVFLGWYKDASLTEPITTIQKGSFTDLTLYAKYSCTAYTRQHTHSIPSNDFILANVYKDECSLLSCKKNRIVKENAICVNDSIICTDMNSIWTMDENGVCNNGSYLSYVISQVWKVNSSIHLDLSNVAVEWKVRDDAFYVEQNIKWNTQPFYIQYKSNFDLKNSINKHTVYIYQKECLESKY